jgi:signal transduction histidine kinase
MQKILVIDDEDTFRQTTVYVLERKGFETLEADNGVAGAELAHRLLPDLIICDINMEKMDGYGVLESLRQHPATAAIPLILMTGLSDATSMRRGMNLGADDYLTKPFTAPQLFSAIDARLRKHQVFRQNAEKRLAALRANISLALPHEMITPLNGILGPAEMLSTDAESLTHTEVADLGASILQSAERLHRTIQNFLLYGQLEVQAADPQSLAAMREKRTWPLQPLLKARARDRAEIADRVKDLQMEIADGCVAIEQELFTKLVDELLDNAFKFSNAGAPVRMTGSAEGGQYRLSIRDRGLGMDAEQIAAIGAYTQFHRQTREQQGSGLGLTLARRIAELHGGHLDLQSQINVGTTVAVVLPAAEGYDDHRLLALS